MGQSGTDSGGDAMRKLGLIAGMASLATLAAVWSLPAAAGSARENVPGAHEAHDKWPGRDHAINKDDDDAEDQGSGPGSVSVPEPDTLALLALGLGGLGLYSVSRHRKTVQARRALTD
ncbi:MAG: PEP-CTERM sorting domain-containing protein [Gammaproteobacteria bacterium]|nr:MAG: PEP-CTERM sorting domain-containing protein [Gammaproteobacteria bacterium]